MKSFHNHPGFVHFCELVRKCSSELGTNSLLELLRTVALFQVPPKQKVVHTLAKHLESKLSQMEVKQVLFFEERLKDIKLPFKPVLTAEDIAH